MKPGYSTTEFWLALIVTVGGVLSSIYADAEWAQALGAVAAALASAGYGFSRASAKKSAAGDNK